MSHTIFQKRTADSNQAQQCEQQAAHRDTNNGLAYVRFSAVIQANGHYRSRPLFEARLGKASRRLGHFYHTLNAGLQFAFAEFERLA